jgi:hypothetical protein
MKNYTVLLLLLFFTLSSYAQNIQLDNLGQQAKDKFSKKNAFKVSGGLSANTTIYNGNAGSGREPFVYMLNGNLNFSVYGISIPLSFTLSNAGASYNYQFPRLPNRLSLHPRYKWVSGHIGELSMSFSPYSVNGIPVRGVGVELSPRGHFKYAAFYGRLQRAVEYQPDNGNTLAAYKRSAQGVKLNYEQGKYKAALSLFKAKDQIGSLRLKPDSLQIFPQENTTMTAEAALPLLSNLLLSGEYAISALTRDSRAPRSSDSTQTTLLTRLLGSRSSTNIFHALKFSLNYTIGSSMIGVGFERIDPGYSTLGALFMNNDLQNITANFAQSLFKGKVNLSGNAGVQRDDLDGKKSGGTNRTVGAVNINYNASQRLTATLSYSNFQTFTNIKPQFSYINQLTPFENLDTLNYRQLSQTANLNLNYVMGRDKNKPQNLNINISFQDAFDEQGGKVGKGNSSQFYNLSAGYSSTNTPKASTLTAVVNLTYNTIGTDKSLTAGPTIGINRQLFGKKVRAGGSLSYNLTQAQNKLQNQVAAFRVNGSYTYHKLHNFMLSLVGMLRKGQTGGFKRDITATVGYNWSFEGLPWGRKNAN